MTIQKFVLFGIKFILIEIGGKLIVIYKDHKYDYKRKFFKELYSLNKVYKFFNWNILIEPATYHQSYREQDMEGELRPALDINSKPTIWHRWYDGRKTRQ